MIGKTGCGTDGSICGTSCHHRQCCPRAASPGVQLDVLLGQQGAVQQEEDALGGDVDPLHERGHGLLHAGLQVALQLHQLLAMEGAVSEGRLELQTKVHEDYAKFYNQSRRRLLLGRVGSHSVLPYSV